MRKSKIEKRKNTKMPKGKMMASEFLIEKGILTSECKMTDLITRIERCDILFNLKENELKAIAEKNHNLIKMNENQKKKRNT